MNWDLFLAGMLLGIGAANMGMADSIAQAALGVMLVLLGSLQLGMED